MIAMTVTVNGGGVPVVIIIILVSMILLLMVTMMRTTQNIHSFRIFIYSARYFLLHLFKFTTTQRRSRLQRSYMPTHYRQLRVKDLPKVCTWQLEWDSNLRPSGRKAPNLPLSHHAPRIIMS